MTDGLNEQLSACLDGELPPAELDLLLKRLGREAELRAAIGRYSLIGESMRAERPAVASRDFAGKVMAAVAAEPVAPRTNGIPNHGFPNRGIPNRAGTPARAPLISPATVRYLRPAVGMAIAAGVAAVAVLTLQPTLQPESAGPRVAASQPAPRQPVATSASTADSSYVVPTSTSTNAIIPATRLTNYVVAHSEYSSPLGRRSVLSGVLADDEEELRALESGQVEVRISIDDEVVTER